MNKPLNRYETKSLELFNKIFKIWHKNYFFKYINSQGINSNIISLKYFIRLNII